MRKPVGVGICDGDRPQVVIYPLRRISGEPYPGMLVSAN